MIASRGPVRQAHSHSQKCKNVESNWNIISKARYSSQTELFTFAFIFWVRILFLVEFVVQKNDRSAHNPFDGWIVFRFWNPVKLDPLCAMLIQQLKRFTNMRFSGVYISSARINNTPITFPVAFAFLLRYLAYRARQIYTPRGYTQCMYRCHIFADYIGTAQISVSQCQSDESLLIFSPFLILGQLFP